MKKIIAYMLALVLCISIPVQAFAYAAGDRTMEVTLSDYSKVVNASYNNGTMSINAGGRAVYDVYVPFNAVQIEMKCTIREPDTQASLYLDDSMGLVDMTGSSVTYTIPNILRQGQHQLILCPNKDIEIYKITFYKEDREVAPAATQAVPALTDFEKAIQTAVIISANSPVMMVNGGKRYIDNEDINVLPYVENGQLYLPIHAFARAFGFYYEEQGADLVLMKENATYLLQGGVLTKQLNSAEPVLITNIIRQINGKNYVPVRYFAELEGKTVANKDDLFVIEYFSNAKAILSEPVYGTLKEQYAQYYPQGIQGRTYYVSKSCAASDENDGSEGSPFRSIEKACEVAQAGDVVIIGEGTYYETLAPKNNGTATAPITFKAAEGAKVLLSACATLGSPVAEENGLLVYDTLVDLGAGRNQIFYQQDNLTAARHPNTHTSVREVADLGLHSLWPTQGNIRVVQGNSLQAQSETDLDQPADYWKGGILVAMTGGGWSLGTAKIERSEPGMLYLTDTTNTWWFDSEGTETDYAYITDCKNAIDVPGEWAIENGKLYIMPPEGETAETLHLEQKVRQVVLDLADNQFIRIEGIDTYGGGIKMNNSEMCMLKDGEYRYISHYTHTMDQREGFIDARDNYNPNGAPPRGEMGIYLGGQDNILINNHIAYSAAAGIYCVGKYEYIENNVVSDCGYMGSYVGGIYLATEAWGSPETPRGGNAIFNNTAYNAGRHVYGVCTNEQWYTGSGSVLPAFLPDEVAYNEFYNGSLSARDTGTVYIHGAVMGTDRLKSKFHNNMVYDSWSFDSFNIGIYYDNWMSMVEVYDNVVFYTDERIEPTKPVYLQLKSSFPTSYATIDAWNNAYPGLVKGGKEALKAEDYPNGKRFLVGATTMAEDVTPYLNSLDEQTDDLYTITMESECSASASIADGLFRPSRSGDWVCFPNVDFSNGKNNIQITYTGDIYNTGDTVTVLVGDSINDPLFSDSCVLNATALYTWGKKTESFIVRGVKRDTANVYVRIDDFKSINIEKIKLSAVYDDMANVTTSIYASSGEMIEGSAKIGQTVGSDPHPYLNETYAPLTLKYEGINVVEDCDEFLIKISSAGEYAGQVVQLHLGSAQGEVLAEYTVDKNDWNDYSLSTVPMNRTLEAGKYDFYITISGSGTSNFFWYGMQSSGQQSTDDQAQ